MANLSIKTGTISRSMLVGNPAFQPGSFESIATANGTGSSSTITFSSIPSTYKHLQIRGIVKNASTFTGDASFTVTFNGVGGTSYAWHQLRGNGSAAAVSSGASQSSMVSFYTSVSSNAAYANRHGVFIMDIHDYASTTKNKTMRLFAGVDTNGAKTDYVSLSSGLFVNTAAISSITITEYDAQNWTTTTQLSLYGIKG
jgi:hypothetical protein